MIAAYRWMFGCWLITAVAYAIQAHNWIAVICAVVCVATVVYGEIGDRRHRARLKAIEETA